MFLLPFCWKRRRRTPNWNAAGAILRPRRSPPLVVTALILIHLFHLQCQPSDARASSQNIETTSKDDLVCVTESGRVRGIRYHMPYLPRPVDAYLGIPFAQPPLNSLRFRHPQPIEGWSGIYNATRLPNSCYQLHDHVFGTEFHGSNVWNPPGKVSEDCLYLNVWVPRNTPRLRKSAVMVWIYGGGFYSGTTTLNVYDGKIMAAQNNVIVVSISYRVGPFGFLSLGHPSAPSNAGLFDQLMGLEWVQNNIRHFGGDPNNVTLFGESAGSVSVSLHLLSPLSHSKFQRAILQSGTALMPWSTLAPAEAQRRSLEFAFQYLDCEETTDMEKVADCLRAVTPQRLADEQFVTRGLLQFPFLPVVDGVFLRDAPAELLRRRAFKRCPLLIGSNANEGSWFIIYELPEFLNLTRMTMTRDQFQTSLQKLFFYYPQYPQEISTFAMDAITYQYTNWVDQDDMLANVKMLESAVGDSQFICSLNQWSLAYAEANEKVYAYFFTQRYSVNPWPRWMGVLHGDEIMFMFGEAQKPGQNYSFEDRELSRLMMNYWTNFAKTGDPNQSPGIRSLDEWPLHTPRHREYLELNSHYIGQPDKSQAVRRGPRLAECAFWDVYLPQLISGIENLRNPGNAGQVVQPNMTCSNSASWSAHSSSTAATAVVVVVVVHLLVALLTTLSRRSQQQQQQQLTVFTLTTCPSTTCT